MKTTLSLAALASALLALPACDDTAEAPERDMRAEPVADGSVTPDAGEAIDADPRDAADPLDAADPDAAAPDQGVTPDAAEPDAADPIDASEPDAAPDAALDDTPPVVALHTPRAGDALTAHRVEITGRVTDDTAIAAAWLHLGDAEPTPIALDPDGHFALTARPIPGPNVARVVAEDTAGNPAEATAAFHFGSRAAAGGLHTGFIVDGTLWTWGRHNRGQAGIGEGMPASQPAPMALEAPRDVASLTFIVNSSIALTTDGRVWTWGDNGDGQLGLGDPAAAPDAEPDHAHRFAPEAIEGIADAVAVSRGFSHGLVLRADGTVLAFGANDNGQLGDGTTEPTDHPVAVAGLDDVIKVVGGSQHSVALRGDGTVWTWGRNAYGNLGDGTVDEDPHPMPAEVPMIADAVDIASGRDHVLVALRDGRVFAWGLGQSGQLGIGISGDEADRAAPVPVDGIDDAIRVFAGGNMSFVLRADGTLWGFGQNFNGQLGTGDTTEITAPVTAVVGLEDIVDVGPGATHVTAIRRDGARFVWGWNSQGSLGDPELLNNWAFPEPIEVELP